jgi:predicted GTPase
MINSLFRNNIDMATVEPLIKQQLTPKRLLYRPCAVVMGRTGAGKTTLVNGLCGTKHAAGEGRGSVTRNLFRNDVSWGEYAFSLIDTPGTDSSTETYKHAILLREGLTATKINTIFIVIKYDGRFEKMIENYLEVGQPVYNYTRKVVVMISYGDQSKNPQNSFKEICELFQEECPNVTNLIFCSERSSKTQIANLMYNCISNMEEEKLDINDTDFHLNFNIHQMRSQMKISFGQYQKKADLLVQEYTELINSVKSASVEDKDEVLHMTIVKFKDEMETLLQEFRQQHGSAMQELDYYAFYIKMEKENVRICDEFVEKVVPFMSYNLFDNQDPRNLIKRCPHCYLIWFKTEGCDGVTTCGNNSFGNRRKLTGKAFWKYQLTRIGGKLKWEKNPANQNNFDDFNENLEEPAEVSRHNLFGLYHRKMRLLFGNVRSVSTDTNPIRSVSTGRNPIRSVSTGRNPIRSVSTGRNPIRSASTDTNPKRIGCGKQFEWGKLPKIEDELILELFKVKTIDQAKQLIQNGSFTEARRDYEFGIDTRFYP